MTGETLWNIIIDSLTSSEEELQTTTGLWFKVSSSNGKLYVNRATRHEPSSKLTTERVISKRDFLYVNSYYDRWTKGDTGIRYKVSRKSRNTAYIFALVEKYSDA